MEEDNKPSKLTNFDSAGLKETVSNSLAQKIRKKLSILITGKIGVGKSRLVNALVGQQVATESRERLRGRDRVRSYSVIFGVEVIVWDIDSPGLQDRSRSVTDEVSCFQELVQHGFDLMIYCCRMDSQRFTREDDEAIETLTNVFGRDIWKKTVIALTFANRIEDPDGEDREAFFRDEDRHWRAAINGFLGAEVRIDSRVLGAIPIVAAGNYRTLRLPTSENWLSELWISCFLTMDISSSLAFYQINRQRLVFASAPALPDESDRSDNQGAAALADAPEIQQVIPLTREQEERVWGRVREFVTTSVDDRKAVLAYITFLATMGITGFAVLRYLLR